MIIPAVVFGGLIAAAAIGFWRCFVRLNRQIERALSSATGLEETTRRLYDEPDGLARELLEETKPR